MKTYAEFLINKAQCGERGGFKPHWMPDFLFDFQAALVDWNCWMGRSATFADCGLGKTPMQLVWGDNIVQHTNKAVLCLTPLAVSQQTIREADKFGVAASRSTKIAKCIHVANYERLHYYRPEDFGGVICDESSCLKAFDGQRRAQVTEFMRTIPYRLLCTATAAPNDYIELGTSSEALGVMGQLDMLQRFFVNDQNTCDRRQIWRRSPAMGGPVSRGWRFKGHAETPFFKWVVGWARAARKPSDLGPYSDRRFKLPNLIEREHIVETRTLGDGMLFALPATNRQEEMEERRRTIPERCEMAAELTANTGKPFVIWCHLNDEGDLLEKIVPDCKQVYGAMPDEQKEEAYEAFASGQIRGLVTKHKIGAWGLNWQHCPHVVEFAGHSFEQHYQGVRRCWRFGQKEEVINDIISTEGQRGAKENLRRKSDQADRMFTMLVQNMNESIKIEAGVRYDNELEKPAWL